MPNKQPPPSLEDYVDAVRPDPPCPHPHGAGQSAEAPAQAVKCPECGVFYASSESPHRPLPGHLAAERTLEALGYSYRGGERWAPPIGPRSPRVLIVTNRAGAEWGDAAHVVAPGVALVGFGYNLIYVDSGVSAPQEWLDSLAARLYPGGRLWFGKAPDEPIPMVLHCPECHTQHIDAPEPGRLSGCAVRHRAPWDNPPHRSHLCHNCGLTWRPADVPTTGVQAITTKGKADTWPVKPPLTVW